MDKQSHETSRQTREPAAPREPDQPMRQVFAAEAAAAKDARVTEPVVATDGQLVEAGYGHGV